MSPNSRDCVEKYRSRLCAFPSRENFRPHWSIDDGSVSPLPEQLARRGNKSDRACEKPREQPSMGFRCTPLEPHDTHPASNLFFVLKKKKKNKSNSFWQMAQMIQWRRKGYEPDFPFSFSLFPLQLRRENYGYCKTATAAPKNASLSSADTNRLVPTLANHSAATFVYP